MNRCGYGIGLEVVSLIKINVTIITASKHFYNREPNLRNLLANIKLLPCKITGLKSDTSKCQDLICLKDQR